MSKTSIILCVLIVYNVAMLAIGLVASRLAKTKEGFLTGNRQLGGIMGALAYVASNSSAWILVGYTGFVYAMGLQAIWLALGILAGFWACWVLAGPKLAAEAQMRGHLTLVDFLAADAQGGFLRAIRTLAALLIVFCFCFYIASQFQAAGQALVHSLHLNPLAGLLIGASIVLAYTFLGGFWAVAATDAVQGTIMALVAIIIPISAVHAAGGFGAIFTALSHQAGYLDIWGHDGASHTQSALLYAGAGIVLGGLGVGVASLGQPHNLNWLLSLRDNKARQLGTWISMIWGIAVYAGMGAAALAARALYGPPQAGEEERVLFLLSEGLTHPIVQGLVIAAILAAIMSTVDSQLLVTSAAISHDLGLDRLSFDSTTDSEARARASVWVVRFAIITVAIVAILLSLYLPATIFRRVLFAWSALGAAFGPIVVTRILGVRSQGWAVLAAMTSGFILTVIMNAIPDLPGDFGEYLLPWLPSLLILLAFRQKTRLQAETISGK